MAQLSWAAPIRKQQSARGGRFASTARAPVIRHVAKHCRHCGWHSTEVPSCTFLPV